jgi:hypothetical protein
LQAALALRWASFAERLHARASTHASIAAAVDYRRAALALLGEHVCSARHAAEAAASTVSAATCGGIPRGTVLWAHGAMIRCRFSATICSSNVHCAQCGAVREYSVSSAQYLVYCRIALLACAGVGVCAAHSPRAPAQAQPCVLSTGRGFRLGFRPFPAESADRPVQNFRIVCSGRVRSV